MSGEQDITCAICNTTDNHVVYGVREMMQGTRHLFHYMECSACGCVQLLDAPENMGPYYDKGYYSLEQSPAKLFQPAAKGWLKKHRDHYAITGSGLLGKWIDTRMPSPNKELYNLRKAGLKKSFRMLDVGAGAGLLTYIFYNAGFKNIVGIDPYLKQDIKYQNGLIIKNLTLKDIKEKNWDAILFHHSFEHMPQPYEVLSQVKELLKPGGKCIIRIPTSSSFAWRHYHENWVQLDAPRHYFLYSIPSLEILAQKAGFSFRWLADESTSFQFLGSEQYKMNIPLRGDERSYFEGNNKLFAQADINAYEQKATALNQERDGDSISILMQKN